MTRRGILLPEDTRFPLPVGHYQRRSDGYAVDIEALAPWEWQMIQWVWDNLFYVDKRKGKK